MIGPPTFNAIVANGDEDDVPRVFTEVFTGILSKPDTGQRVQFH